MTGFFEIFQELILETLKQVYEFILSWGPKIVLSAVILLIGWSFAVLLKKIIAKLLKAMGFDVLAKKIGFKRFLERGGIKKNPSYIIGSIFYWIIIVSALFMIFTTLNLEIAVLFLQQVIWYIPKIVVGVILLILAWQISKFVARFVDTTSRLAGIPFYYILSKISKFIIMILAVLMLMEYFDVTAFISIQLFIIIFAVLPVLFFMVLLISGKEIVSDMIAYNFIKKEYKRNDIIEFNAISGEIIKIDIVNTKLKKDDSEIIIPNNKLYKAIIKKKKQV